MKSRYALEILNNAAIASHALDQEYPYEKDDHAKRQAELRIAVYYGKTATGIQTALNFVSGERLFNDLKSEVISDWSQGGFDYIVEFGQRFSIWQPEALYTKRLKKFLALIDAEGRD